MLNDNLREEVRSIVIPRACSRRSENKTKRDIKRHNCSGRVEKRGRLESSRTARPKPPRFFAPLLPSRRLLYHFVLPTERLKQAIIRLKMCEVQGELLKANQRQPPAAFVFSGHFM